MYETINSSLNYGGLTLKKRILFAPTSLGLPQEELLERMKKIAAGGCAMIIIGDVPVLPHGFGPSLYTKKGIEFYKSLADAVHPYGCKLCAQLHQSDSNLKGMIKYIPGVLTKRISMQELRPLLNQQVGPYITGLPEKKVEEITDAFGKAAELAIQAGFDMVQVHGDRMCGSFSSSVFNHRTDRYGGNPHYGNAGVLEEELPIFVPLLEQAGVTSFHVTLANHGELSNTIPPKNHPEFGAEGCFLKFCDQVRKLTKLPICGVGGLTDPDFVEEQLKSGRIDCAAMSRQLTADPEWPNKVCSGRAGELHRCVRCNKKCLGGMMAHQGVHCIYERKETK